MLISHFCRYECVPLETSSKPPAVPLKLTSVCTLAGTMLQTFDNTTFTKDICYHTLFMDGSKDLQVQCKFI